VKKELGHRPAIRRQEPYSLPDAMVCGFPDRGIVVEAVQSPEFFFEERPDSLEPASGPDFGVEPGEVTTRHHQVGEQPSPSTSCQTRTSWFMS
jgi:hypothetical protein